MLFELLLEGHICLPPPFVGSQDLKSNLDLHFEHVEIEYGTVKNAPIFYMQIGPHGLYGSNHAADTLVTVKFI